MYPPNSGSRSPTETDLEGVNHANQSSEMQIAPTYVPVSNHLETTTQRFLKSFDAVGRLWKWIVDHTWKRSQGLPVHRYDLQSRQQPQLRWEKSTVINLTFQAVIGLTLAGQPSDLGDELHHLHIFGMVMLFAFACSFSGILLDHAYPMSRAARILEKMGYVSAALGFYLISSIFLPNNFTWICWVASAVSLLAFSLALKAEWDC